VSTEARFSATNAARRCGINKLSAEENRKQVVAQRSQKIRGDWKRETWHLETIEIVEAEMARLDNSVPYRKGGHRETCFIVRVEAQYKKLASQ